MLDNFKFCFKYFIFGIVIFSLAVPATITISGLFSETVYAQKRKKEENHLKQKELKQ